MQNFSKLNVFITCLCPFIVVAFCLINPVANFLWVSGAISFTLIFIIWHLFLQHIDMSRQEVLIWISSLSSELDEKDVAKLLVISPLSYPVIWKTIHKNKDPITALLQQKFITVDKRQQI